jgi:putative oxygen-independent coproporphyrinogen III oxidase
VLTPHQAAAVVEWVTRRFNLQPAAEITLEVNPATVTTQTLREFAAVGFNRLNIGIQSFNDAHLSFLGRRHNAAQALEALKAARQAGFSNIGMDLIYGLPDQGAAVWEADLRQAVGLEPHHVACYILSYEPHTPLDIDLRAGRLKPLSDGRVADLFRRTHDLLSAAGYEHYEISNFARGRHRRSGHNSKYWNLSPYIGLGPTAHSFDCVTRWWNHDTLDAYLAALKRGSLPCRGREHLDDDQQMMEALYLGLRQADGIDLTQFRERFQVDFERYFQTALKRFARRGWLQMDSRRCSLTVEGMLFLDRIAGELVELME